MKIKKDDLVKIISGKDRGKTAKVLKVFKQQRKVVIEGLNLQKKHVRPKKEGEKGQRIETPRAIPVSNIMIVCPKCQKTTRIGYIKKGNNKFRICKKCKAEI